MAMLVGRVRALYPYKGLGFITHNFGEHFLFYFSGIREFVKDQFGNISYGGKMDLEQPPDGSYIIFREEDIVYSKSNNPAHKPVVLKWGLASEFYALLKEEATTT